jgi:1,4-dihydroxy-2-naphthoate octaprenyltransferase
MTALAYLSLPLLVLAGLPPLVAALAALPAPIALWRVRRMLHGDWRRRWRWEAVAFFAVGLLVATTVCELVAFAILL